MKTIIILSIFILLSFDVHSQNITSTLGTNGVFRIRDDTRSLMSLDQPTGMAEFSWNIKIENTVGPTAGIIFKGSDRFLHNYIAPGTNGSNTFLGLNAGNFTMTGTGGESSSNTAIGHSSLSSLTTGYNNTSLGTVSLYYNSSGYKNTALGSGSMYTNITGYDNTAVGYVSMYTNQSGYENTAVGNWSLFFNNPGFQNTAVGFKSLYSNFDGVQNTSVGHNSLYNNTSGSSNTAVGFKSLYSNFTGYNNSAFGTFSLFSNTTGYENSAFGLYSLYLNSSGNRNSAFGYNSLQINTMGDYNSAFGYNSLYSNGTGNKNSAFGVNSGDLITTGSNNTTIGFNAQVPSGSSSNQVRIGNTDVTYAGVQVAWTITSDRKWKSNILNSNLGLSFINKLNPVSYTRKNDESQKTEYGLIAQEVQEVLKEEGVENSGMLTVTDEGNYELRYNDLMAPMIKAIQELEAENDELKQRLAKLDELISEIQKQSTPSGNLNVSNK